MTSELHKAAINLGRAAFRMPAMAPVRLMRRLMLRRPQVQLAPGGLGQLATAHRLVGLRGVARQWQQPVFWLPFRHARVMTPMAAAGGRRSMVAPFIPVVLQGARLSLLAKPMVKLRFRQHDFGGARPVEKAGKDACGPVGAGWVRIMQKRNSSTQVHRKIAAGFAIPQYRVARPVAMTMKSLAPVTGESLAMPPRVKPLPWRLPAAAAYTGVQSDAVEAGRPTMTSEVEMARTLEGLLARQARLPPRGMTGFDPRLTPAWAGLKLPN